MAVSCHSSERSKRLRVGIWCDPGSWRGSRRLGAYLRRVVAALARRRAETELIVATAWPTPRLPAGLIDCTATTLAPGRLLYHVLEMSHVWVRWSDYLADVWESLTKWLGERAATWLRGGKRLPTGVLLGVAIAMAIPAVIGLVLLCLTAALLRGLLFPLLMLDRVMRRIEFALRSRAQQRLLDAGCDVWLIPRAALTLPRFLRNCTVIHDGDLLDGDWALSWWDWWDRQFTRSEKEVHWPALWVSLSPRSRNRDLYRPLRARPENVRVISPDRDLANPWLKVLHAGSETAAAQRGLDPTLLAAWPRVNDAVAAVRRPLEVFIFLQMAWGGGNWEHTRHLAAALTRIARREGELRLAFGIHHMQPGAWALQAAAGGMPVHRLHFNAITRDQAAQLGYLGAPNLAGRNEQVFSFLSGAAEAMLHADAWLALSDRFPLPLLPLRPYAVVVHDMIHLHVPAALDRTFFINQRQGMTPTLRHADAVIATSPDTRRDILAHYRLPPQRVKLIPVACEPHRRFDPLPRGYVPLPRESFLLNVTNASPHKGAELVLRGYAGLAARLGREAPLLVMCGVNTEYLAPSNTSGSHPYFTHIRAVVRELNLKEDRDVVFLGPVTDMELKDLYARCRAVVNAARHDNGTYCLIEGCYFGKPVVSTEYPAARFLAERFGLPVRFFPVGDEQELAAVLHDALAAAPMSHEARELFRLHLADPEFSVDRYAERLHTVLLELARKGRQQRLAPVLVEREA